MALVRSARYQQQLRKYHSKHVQELNIMQGNLFLRRVQTTKGKNKFTPPWEGPFIMAKVQKLGTYKLANKKGEVYTMPGTSTSYDSSTHKKPALY